MSEKDWGVRLFDILRSISLIESYTKDVSFEDFSQDQMRFDAVVRNFQIIGDAVKKIPTTVLTLYTGINWQEIKGMRDIVVHDYSDINKEAVWAVIREELTALKETVKKIQSDTGK